MKSTKAQTQDQLLANELTGIASLLHSEVFALSIAQALHSAYYVNLNKTPPPFLLPGDDTARVKIEKQVEKVATNLAGFYALECGLGAICAQTNQKPTGLLETVVTQKADAPAILLLNRFANATWKAGQPFRGLDRIKRPIFTVANVLSNEDVQKDYDQILMASAILLTAMQDVRDQPLTKQMTTLRSLLQNKSFAIDMATRLAAGYYTAQHKPVPPFLAPEDKKATLTKSVKEQKIATNLAGFYALECGVNYLVTTRQKLPSEIMQSISEGTISDADKQLLCRFANATWKAGQPFLGLHRITRVAFTPFCFLAETDVAKDWAQIKAAAKAVMANL